MTITCPTCGHTGIETEFEPSCAGEYFCPNGCECFILNLEGDDDEDE